VQPHDAIAAFRKKLTVGKAQAHAPQAFGPPAEAARLDADA